MATIREQLDETNEKFLQQPKTHRIAFVALVGVGLVAAWYSLFLTGWQRQLSSNEQNAGKLQASVKDLTSKKMEILARQDMDPDKMHRAERDELQKKLADARQDLAQATKKLVRPQQMVRILEQVLLRENTLRLVEIASLPVVEVRLDVPPDAKGGGGKEKSSGTPKKEGPSAANADEKIYQHGVTMLIEGDYLGVLRYLKSLEQVPWVIHWDKLEYAVVDYPHSTIRLSVYTISNDQAWVGL